MIDPPLKLEVVQLLEQSAVRLAWKAALLILLLDLLLFCLSLRNFVGLSLALPIQQAILMSFPRPTLQ